MAVDGCVDASCKHMTRAAAWDGAVEKRREAREKGGREGQTRFFSVFALMSVARVKKASLTFTFVLALVSMNLVECSIAS